eukprot:TRINITY_DN2745_c0_g2_i2.p1 TRINITY_DN2745_c0_g2~~TRINITY_DN2745_c0_g2_i2.p1  ORF type:complete len:399 (-),score=84.24 TRINITY_DN2745_c0_g2_i2:43-1203(-)
MDDEPPLLDEISEPKQQRTRVTILTGFLGAGKSTLIRYILTQQHGKRIAVIENELAADAEIERSIISIDQDATRGDIFEMSNGCLCCTAKGQLVTTIEALMERSTQFDYILVECSGMADPGPVASSFWVDAQLESPLQLDGIVAVVDAKHIGAHLSEVKAGDVVNEAQRQIAYADKILVNKTDLVSADELAQLHMQLQRINPTAEVLFTNNCNFSFFAFFSEFGNNLHTKALNTIFASVDLSQILDIGAFDGARLQLVDEQHRHDSDIHAISVHAHGLVDVDKIERWLGSILWDESVSAEQMVFRVKGILSVRGATGRYIVQGVHSMFEILPTSLPLLEHSENKVVFIGRGVQQEVLEAGLRGCVVEQVSDVHRSGHQHHEGCGCP